MKSLFLLLAAVCVFVASCDRHEFEGPNGTRQLHEHGPAAAHHDEPAPGDAADH